MASIKVKYRPSSIPGRMGTIYYQIIHERKVRQLNTCYRVFAHEWSVSQTMVKCGDDVGRGAIIHSIRQKIRRDVERLSMIGRKLEDDGLHYSPDDLIAEFRQYKKEYSLSVYMERLIEKFKLNGRMRTSETYSAALNSFGKFLDDTRLAGLNPDEPFMLENITSDVMEQFEAWHRRRGNSPNTISFYMRILRAVYNRAVDDGIIADCNPFRRVYTGVEKTLKRALPLSIIKRIKSLDLTDDPTLAYARDMFMMSFYLRGMSFIDMSFLKKSDLRNGSVIYRRRKTGQQLTIGWTREMQSVIDRYADNPTQYLLPIIMTAGCNERCAYRNASYAINRSLRKVADMVGIQSPVTMYVARHSWASAARAKGIPLSVISEGMGHDSEATTRIYLASLDTSVVDKANAIILSSL